MSRSRRRRKKKGNFHPSSGQRQTLSYSLSQDITKDKSPEVKRNSHGDVIYSMKYIGDEKLEYWVDFDEKNRPTHYRDSRGNDWKCMYNSKGNISIYWDNTGYEEYYKYYANNLVICTTSFGEKIKKCIDRESRFITRDIFINSNDYI